MFIINENDLQYVFNQISEMKPNFYTSSITIGTIQKYINFLRNAGINHTVNNEERKSITLKDKNENEIAIIRNPIYPGNSTESRKIAKNKIETEKLLIHHGINTTDSKVYTFEELELAKKTHLNKNNKKLVIKPLSSSLGTGVYVNVTLKNIDKYWRLCKKSKNYKNNDKIIVQNYLEGFEVRATVMEGFLVAVSMRVPPFVIGDGKNSISELVKIKNKRRKKCEFLKRYPIEISERVEGFLEDNNKSMNDKPVKGEYVLLSSVSNISGGGELINVTDYVCNEIKETALNSIAALPKMCSGGVDIMIKSFDDDKPAVIEVNSFPVLSLVTYPTYGDSINPMKYLVESLISKHQFFTKNKDKYKNIHEEFYINNYINFLNIKKELHFKHKSQGYLYEKNIINEFNSCSRSLFK